MNMAVAELPLLNCQIVVFPLQSLRYITEIFVVSPRNPAVAVSVLSVFRFWLEPFLLCTVAFVLHCRFAVTHVSSCHIAYSSVVRKLRTSSVAESIIVRRMDVCYNEAVSQRRDCYKEIREDRYDYSRTIMLLLMPSCRCSTCLYFTR